jgi:predicted MFS family arabinose efflux permease
VLAGASLAGTYMPGLKLIADRLDAVPHPRLVAFYTTSFTVGASLSFYAIGQLDQVMPWRAAVAAAALGPLTAWFLVYLSFPALESRGSRAAPARGQWRDVLQSGDTMRYVVGYACHTWELFGVRAWLVPFFVFCVARHGETVAAPATLAAVVALVGVPASIGGAELSARLGSRRLIAAVMLASAAASLALGLASTLPWAAILAVAIGYSAVIGADSAALTSGLVAVAPQRARGTAMAVYSMAGFAAAAAAAAAVGAALDRLGGESVANWTIAFGMLGAANVLGVAVLRRAR